ECADTSGFGPPAESLDSLRSPFGPACGCYSASLRISLLAEKVTKEKARTTSGPGYAGVPSLRCRSGDRHEGASLPLRSSLGVLPRVPLRNTSTRPPDGEWGPSRLEDCWC